MEMHQLRYVVAVARTGNFSRASEQCHVSQPSLSQQILKLEDELGERLFDRLKKGARPTAHGRLFIARAERILAEVDAVRREAEDAKHQLSGSLTVGVLPTIAPYLLPVVLARFGAAHPAVEVVVHEETTPVLVRQVLAHEVDFIIASPPLSDERLETRKLFTEELMLAVPAGHPLAKRKAPKLEELAAEPFIVMKEGHCLGDQVRQFCTRNTSGLRVSFRSSQLETIRALVGSGLGVSLIPAMATRITCAGDPVYRRMATPRPERTICGAWPKNRGAGRAADAFMRTIAECADEITGAAR